MRKLLLLTVLYLSGYALIAQQFGGNPPSLKWRQINTDTARIIYPAGLDSQANRVAAMVHLLAARNRFRWVISIRKWISFCRTRP